MAVQVEVDQQAELDRIYQLLRQGKFEEARSTLVDLAAHQPEWTEVAELAHKLARPRGVLRPDAPRICLEQERAWLRKHAREHRGCWVAVSGETLVAADPDYDKVIARAQETVGVENVVLYFQP